jgi:hypothetical protein
LATEAGVIGNAEKTGFLIKILGFTKDIPAIFSDTDFDELSSILLHIHQQKTAFLSNPRKDFTRQSFAKLASE